MEIWDRPYRICPVCGCGRDIKAKNSHILPPGTILNGKYLVGPSLGAGGFGITYLVLDLNLGVKAAIKEYFPGIFASRDTGSKAGNTVLVQDGMEREYSEGLTHFTQEAGILSRFFELPGIVTVKDFFYENSTAYIVMEYIDGISLKEYLKERGGRISYSETLNLMMPVISSLAIVHKNMLLHRDISPDNIMVTGGARVKLIDFGAARSYQDSRRSMTVILKQGYAPYEQYYKNGVQGTWTDIYALCATMYRMIAGKVPPEAVERKEKDSLVPLSSLNLQLPPNISKAIEKGLSIAPEMRQQTMQELYDDLYNARSNQADRSFSIQKILLLIVFLSLLTGFAFVGTAILIRRSQADQASATMVRGNSSESGGQTEDISQSAKQAAEAGSETAPEAEGKAPEASESQTDIRGRVTIREDENPVDNTNENEAGESSIGDPNENEAEDTVPEKGLTDNTDENNYTNDNTGILETSIMVVRDGTFDSSPNGRTTGELFDAYSDSPGRWSGFRDNSGQVFVSYEGKRNGTDYSVIFLVYQGTKFKITAVSRNNQPLYDYGDFIREILNGG